MKLKTKFQDEDFELGEVVKAEVFTYRDDDNKVVVMVDTAGDCAVRFEYNSIKDFTDHWEDAPKEPKTYWTVECGVATEYTEGDEKYDRAFETVGLKFDTKEECERAIEKMKAWTRLKNKGLKIRLRSLKGYSCLEANWGVLEGDYSDVRLLFGGEK